MKTQMQELEKETSGLTQKIHTDKEHFLKFAFSFVNNISNHFLSISPENRIKCRQIIFPSGFRIDGDKNVYTPKISPLYILAANKKDLPK